MPLRLFVVEVHIKDLRLHFRGKYFCAVHAFSPGEADHRAQHTHGGASVGLLNHIPQNQMQESENVLTELLFNQDGVSNMWYVPDAH